MGQIRSRLMSTAFRFRLYRQRSTCFWFGSVQRFTRTRCVYLVSPVSGSIWVFHTAIVYEATKRAIDVSRTPSLIMRRKKTPGAVPGLLAQREDDFELTLVCARIGHQKHVVQTILPSSSVNASTPMLSSRWTKVLSFFWCGSRSGVHSGGIPLSPSQRGDPPGGDRTQRVRRSRLKGP